jgi:hypothetical protein
MNAETAQVGPRNQWISIKQPNCTAHPGEEVSVASSLRENP